MLLAGILQRILKTKDTDQGYSGRRRPRRPGSSKPSFLGESEGGKKEFGNSGRRGRRCSGEA